MRDQDRLLFVQARYGSIYSRPERELPQLPGLAKLGFTQQTETLSVRHGNQGCLRYHEVPIEIFRQAARRVFFEPRPQCLTLYEKYNSQLKELISEWWDKIADSRRFKENLEIIRAYHSTLKAGAITLIGLIAEGAQGMRTGNNARFIADGRSQQDLHPRRRRRHHCARHR